MIELKFVLEATLAFVAVFVATPVVIALCNRWKLYDAPGPLKIHTKPISRLGGVAVTLALLAGSVAAGMLTHTPLAGFIASVATLAVIGVVDDLRRVSPYVRLAFQFAIGLYLAISGLGIALTNSTGFNVLLTASVVVAFINAFNFLDGSDALSAGVASVIALAYIASAGPNFSAFSSIVAWALLGSASCFLIFNAPPARIFLGDSGSTVIGLAVAFLALEHLRAARSYANPGVSLFPFVVAAVPLVDAALAIARRLQNSASLVLGDREHFYDLLLQRGFSAGSVALIAAGASAAAGLVGRIALACTPPAAGALIAVFFGALVAAGVWIGSFKLHAVSATQHVPASAVAYHAEAAPPRFR